MSMQSNTYQLASAYNVHAWNFNSTNDQILIYFFFNTFYSDIVTKYDNLFLSKEEQSLW